MARQERDAACKAGSFSLPPRRESTACDVVVNSLLQTRLQAAAFCILSLLVCCLALYCCSSSSSTPISSFHKRSRAARTELNAFTPQAFFRNSSASACVVCLAEAALGVWLMFLSSALPRDHSLCVRPWLPFSLPLCFALVGSAPPAQCSRAERAVCSASLRARAQL